MSEVNSTNYKTLTTQSSDKLISINFDNTAHKM